MLILGVAAACMAIVLAAAVAADGDEKAFVNPAEGQSDEERQAFIDQAHRDNAAWFHAFVAGGADARELGEFRIESYAGPVETLTEASSLSGAVIFGTVESQSFAIEEGRGDIPASTAVVRVRAVGEGDPLLVGSTITVVQIGGPIRVSVEGEGALAQMEWDPLLFEGDEVILALGQLDEGLWVVVPGLGSHRVEGGRVIGPLTTVQSELTGLSVEDALDAFAGASTD